MWATVATLAGSAASLALAATLARRFGGQGLIADALAGSPDLMAAVAAGATATVWLATRLGLPVSTTHALAGAGWLASDGGVGWGVLGGEPAARRAHRRRGVVRHLTLIGATPYHSPQRPVAADGRDEP